MNLSVVNLLKLTLRPRSPMILVVNLPRLAKANVVNLPRLAKANVVNSLLKAAKPVAFATKGGKAGSVPRLVR